MLIGREKERQVLLDSVNEEYSQFIAVYGRRRVGKTFLIRETFNYTFHFQFTGAANLTARKQLSRFRRALKEHGQTDTPELKNWGDAFDEMKRYLNQLPEGKKVIFFDELPWMDAPRSSFLSELESFWNGWASARKDIVFIVCGSSTSWIVNKIIKNKGGLHNRLNHKILLQPFTLAQCELLAQSRGLAMSRQQILEAYMIFGGVPYYWTLLEKGASVAQEVDRLIFSPEGEMHHEFDMLYASLFKKPEPYISVIEHLAKKNRGMTRKELISEGGFDDNGTLTNVLRDLEWCGFIRRYNMMGYKSKCDVFQVVDHYTIFHLEFAQAQRKAANFWKAILGTPRHNTWCGLAFERVCLWHSEQIKKKLGISGILSSESAWRCSACDTTGRRGAQIDLLIDRSDGIIDICEMKYSNKEYAITHDYSKELINKAEALRDVTSTKKAIHIVMVTTEGVLHNQYWGCIQNEVVLDDLFA
ncbi:MAG: ATP-binding protein [Bacteroidales bacterium]|nr:ATP-binding protein [Bacteroidales bacterium]